MTLILPDRCCHILTVVLAVALPSDGNLTEPRSDASSTQTEGDQFTACSSTSFGSMRDNNRHGADMHTWEEIRMYSRIHSIISNHWSNQ